MERKTVRVGVREKRVGGVEGESVCVREGVRERGRGREGDRTAEIHGVLALGLMHLAARVCHLTSPSPSPNLTSSISQRD